MVSMTPEDQTIWLAIMRRCPPAYQTFPSLTARSQFRDEHTSRKIEEHKKQARERLTDLRLRRY